MVGGWADTHGRQLPEAACCVVPSYADAVGGRGGGLQWQWFLASSVASVSRVRSSCFSDYLPSSGDDPNSGNFVAAIRSPGVVARGMLGPAA
jgi:hypothetical protein